jgi:hypothetical protein
MTIARLVPAVLIAVLLTGCAAQAPEPTPVSTPVAESPTPTPTPTPEPVVALVTLTADTITLIDTNGAAMTTFDYFQPTEELVAGFSAAFGFEPSIEHVQPYEGWPYSAIEWEGFILRDIEQESDGLYYPNNRITVTTPAVRGIKIETVGGISVGDDPDAIEAANPDAISYGTNSGRDVFIISYGDIPCPTTTSEKATRGRTGSA